MRSPSAAVAFIIGLAAIAAPVAAQEQPAQGGSPPSAVGTAPYDVRLYRLAEILGSVHYLRTLCSAADADDWRQSMQELIEKEAVGKAGGEVDGETAGAMERRARMTAAFNRGYRSFASVHTQCTPLSVAAEARYRAQGATLAAEIVSRFGN